MTKGDQRPPKRSARDSVTAAAELYGPYRLLNDRPPDPGGDDPLGMKKTAEDLALVLVESLRSSPFVFAVDAGWGMGKSTLLAQIGRCLENYPGVAQLPFNAWTSEGENALEGLIKAVLGELDTNVLRRWVRKLGQQRGLIGIAWLVFGVAARFFGVARMVDTLWAQMAMDAKTRNEIRDQVAEMLSEWLSDSNESSNRALVVFIDDLDRCSDDVVVKICEAVKLYLDVRGLIFVIACDQAVLARSVSLSARGGTGEGRAYLEKIIQVAYRMPPPEDDQVKQLIHEYARESGTSGPIDKAAEILVKGTARNPRRIKRIINSFVLEYRLESAWQEKPLSAALLVTALILQQMYTPFYDLLVQEDSGEDPIEEFLNYIQIHRGLPADDDGKDKFWEALHSSFEAHGLPPPKRASADVGQLSKDLKKLEAKLDDSFIDLADSHVFIELLQDVKKAGASRRLREQLLRRPLAVAGTYEPAFNEQIEAPTGLGRHSNYAANVMDTLQNTLPPDWLLTEGRRISGYRFDALITGPGPKHIVVEVFSDASVSSSLASRTIMGTRGSPLLRIDAALLVARHKTGFEQVKNDFDHVNIPHRVLEWSPRSPAITLIDALNELISELQT